MQSRGRSTNSSYLNDDDDDDLRSSRRAGVRFSEEKLENVRSSRKGNYDESKDDDDDDDDNERNQYNTNGYSKGSTQNGYGRSSNNYDKDSKSYSLKGSKFASNSDDERDSMREKSDLMKQYEKSLKSKSYDAEENLTSYRKSLASTESSYKKSSAGYDSYDRKPDLPNYKQSASPNLSRQQSGKKTALEEMEERDKLSALNKRNGGSRSPIPLSYEPITSSSNLYRSFTETPGKSFSGSRAGNYDDVSLKSTSSHVSLSTIEVKHRSYLSGSTTKYSLLGEAELERAFPDRKLKVFVGTWNMCGLKEIPESLSSFILPDAVEQLCDMYVIGTQESGPNRRQWDIQLQEVLGPHFVLFHSATFGVLNLSVFMRRDLTWYCSVSEEDSVSTRAGSAIKTKGGQGICFTIFGTSLLFINCHLAPHDGEMEQRIADYKKIRAELALPKLTATYQHQFINGDVAKGFDGTFWFGDMNFRLAINGGRSNVEAILKGLEQKRTETYEQVVNHDELHDARNKGTAFEDFTEGRIKFKPTYKYDVGTDNFDTSDKMRVPGYTDRVLFRTKRKGTIQCLEYNSVMSVQCSDHKPVYGIYSVLLRPGVDSIPLCGGQYDKEAWFEGLNRRRQHLQSETTAVRSEQDSKSCSIQ